MRGIAIIVLVAASVATAGASGGIVVVAPHPDDEMIMAGGIIAQAREARRDADVVVVTNGDYYGVSSGLVRQGESVDALSVLGMPERRVFFLGYPDAGLLPLWNNAPGGGTPYTSLRTGQAVTYGTRGFGGADFHTVRTGVPGPYDRATLVDDLTAVLDLLRPAAIYTTGAFDHHPDHRGTFYAVQSAARRLAAAAADFRPTIYTTIVHDPVGYPYDDFWPPTLPRETPPTRGNDDVWPNPSVASGVPNRFLPTAPFNRPPSLPEPTLAWAARRTWAVPAVMSLLDFDANLKVQSLRRYATQAGPVLWAHVKADEFFWADAVRVPPVRPNIAGAARIAVSSAAPGQPATAAVDGVVDDGPAAWAAAGPGTATLRFTWRGPVVIERVVLFDRPTPTDQVIAARLVSDDGGPGLQLGVLANDGRGDEIVLPAPERTMDLTIAIDAAHGVPGLAEVEVFGEPPPPKACVADADCGDGSACTSDHCRALRCANEPVPDGTPCGDDDPCNGVETCGAGTCTRTPALSCDDQDPCTADACEAPGTCRHDDVCAPVAARGPGGCLIGFTGLPAGMCEDGDPSCDRDEATDGGCRFDLVTCVNVGPRTRRCDPHVRVVAVAIGGREAALLAPVVAPLASRLPADTRACSGPTPVRFTLTGRRLRARVPIRVTLADGRVRRAHVRLACRAARPGTVRRAATPLVP